MIVLDRFTLLPVLVFILYLYSHSASAQETKFPWPDGKRMALSLSFDDARASNPVLGIPILNEYDIKATFFVLPQQVKDNLKGWQAAVAAGHEMANHSLQHPCSGNFVWSRSKALEDFTVDRMKSELLQANKEIKALLGVDPEVYAYPCGQTFIGKGVYTQSFVPLISELFLAGRGWLDEAPVDPFYADMAQLTGVKMDNMEFEELLPIIRSAGENGQWLVLAGHETADAGDQTTYLHTLRRLSEYAKDTTHGIWIAPIGTIAKHVRDTRQAMADTLNLPGIVRPDHEEQLILDSRLGRGIGPKIEYMPEWNAFGWFTGKDKVEWQAEVKKSGKYEVILDWSVSDEEAGKEFVFQIGDNQLKGKVGKTGSWETFKESSIGHVELKEGYQEIVFKPENDFGEEGALLDLRKIVLQPVKNQ